MMDSMPARCSSRASIKPDGPAPMMPTCVRMYRIPASDDPIEATLALRKWTIAGKTWIKDLDAGADLAGPAVTRHLRFVAAVGVAEFGFEITLLSRDDAKMYEQHGRHQHDQRPVRGERDAKACDDERQADIHRIAHVSVDALGRERARRLEGIHIGANPNKCVPCRDRKRATRRHQHDA